MSNCYVFEAGDILYGKLRPNLDKCVIADHDGVCTTEILVMNANDLTTNEYMIYHLHSSKFVHHNTHRSYGTRMPRTNINILGKYSIPVPPLEVQETLLSEAEDIRRAISEMELHISRLKNLILKIMN